MHFSKTELNFTFSRAEVNIGELHETNQHDGSVHFTCAVAEVSDTRISSHTEMQLA